MESLYLIDSSSVGGWQVELKPTHGASFAELPHSRVGAAATFSPLAPSLINQLLQHHHPCHLSCHHPRLWASSSTLFFCSNRFFSEFTEAFVNLKRDDICSENLSIQQILFSCHCSALLLYKKKSKLIFRIFFYIKIIFEKCQSISKMGKE